jgi:hypothetical protein
MKFINGAYIDGIDVLTTEIPYYGSESISARINRNYKFSVDNKFNNIYLIRVHVAYIQNELYNSVSFFNFLFLKIEAMGYDNTKDHIVFTMQEEGSLYFSNEIYKLVRAARPNYDTSKICYADEQLNITDNHGEMLRHLNFIHQCNSVHSQPVKNDIEWDKIFLTLNRRHKIHRTMLVGSIIEENLLDKSLVSFFPECENVSFKDILNWDKLFSIGRKHKYYELLDREFILDKNSDVINSNLQPTTSSDLGKLHKRSLISVICETKFDEHEITVTEKTYKAVAYKHPFIILGPQYFLRYFKDLGYQTFHPFINENYDNISDPVERFDAIIVELKRLANLSPSELTRLVKDITPIVEYNHRIHNRNFEFLDHKTTLFLYINQFDKNIQNIIEKSRQGGGILNLRKKF